MATNNNELCFYSVLSDDEKSKASLYYWSNIDSDNMGTTTRPLPPLVLGATDGIVTVKADENNQLYYSYTSAPNGVGKAGRIYIYVVNNGQPAPAIIGMQPAPDDPYDYNILEFNDTSQSGKPADRRPARPGETYVHDPNQVPVSLPIPGWTAADLIARGDAGPVRAQSGFRQRPVATVLPEPAGRAGTQRGGGQWQ